MNSITTTSNLVYQNEAAYLLGVSTLTLLGWRKIGKGPKWQTVTTNSGHGRPMYFRDSVEELRTAYAVLERMNLRHSNCAPLAQQAHEEPGSRCLTQLGQRPEE
jgi:hypothetical protein